jgi:hypothetical protein
MWKKVFFFIIEVFLDGASVVVDECDVGGCIGI